MTFTIDRQKRLHEELSALRTLRADMTTDMQTRVAAYAARKRITTDAALLVLVDAGLRASERAAAAGAKGGTWQRQPVESKMPAAARSSATSSTRCTHCGDFIDPANDVFCSCRESKDKPTRRKRTQLQQLLAKPFTAPRTGKHAR